MDAEVVQQLTQMQSAGFNVQNRTESVGGGGGGDLIVCGNTPVQPHLAGTITEDSVLPFASVLCFANGIFTNRAVVPRYVANTARGRGSTRGHFTSHRSFPFHFSWHFGCRQALTKLLSKVHT